MLYLRLTAIVLFSLACGCAYSQPTLSPHRQAIPATTEPTAVTVDIDDLTRNAMIAAQSLGATLKGRLKATLATGGPVQAIAVCHDEAPVMADRVSADTGFTVGRVSTRSRNALLGQPNAWQQQVLDVFDARLAAGEEPGALMWREVVGKEYRFMKAIPTDAVCLACHGDALAPDVAAAIAQRYPNDRATGFNLGDLRGAFVVTRSLD